MGKAEPECPGEKPKPTPDCFRRLGPASASPTSMMLLCFSLSFSPGSVLISEGAISLLLLAFDTKLRGAGAALILFIEAV